MSGLESKEVVFAFKYELGQNVFYAGIPYGVADRCLDEAGNPVYMIRPFTRGGVSYSCLPVPEEALAPSYRDGDVVWTMAEG